MSTCQYQCWIPTSEYTYMYLLNQTIQANVMWIHRDLIPIKQHRKLFTSGASVSFTVPILGNAESELTCYDFVMSLDISTSINTTLISLSSAVCIRITTFKTLNCAWYTLYNNYYYNDIQHGVFNLIINIQDLYHNTK